jgi:hypothetical protein
MPSIIVAAKKARQYGGLFHGLVGADGLEPPTFCV